MRSIINWEGNCFSCEVKSTLCWVKYLIKIKWPFCSNSSTFKKQSIWCTPILSRIPFRNLTLFIYNLSRRLCILCSIYKYVRKSYKVAKSYKFITNVVLIKFIDICSNTSNFKVKCVIHLVRISILNLQIFYLQFQSLTLNSCIFRLYLFLID